MLHSEFKNISKNEISIRLTELYWQCVLNYNDHGGSGETFKKLFKAVVFSAFPGGR